MGLLDIFGSGGIVGSVMDVLRGTGVIKDPEVELKVKSALLEFEDKAKLRANDLEKIQADDRASARAREIAVKDKTPQILAFISLFGFFGILTALIFADIPPTAKDVLYVMVGVLGTLVTGVVQYYFGSSSGSSNKSESINQLLKEKSK
jgi:hypothetical protein